MRKSSKWSNKMYNFFSETEIGTMQCNHCKRSLANKKHNMRRHLLRKHFEMLNGLQSDESEEEIGN